MSRILSLALFAVTVALIVPSTAVVAQESDSCQKCPVCQTAKFERLGVDFKVLGTDQLESLRPQGDAKKNENEISIELEFDCEVPFLKNLPFFNHVFRSALPNEECEIFVIESDCDSPCATCKKDDSCKSDSCCKDSGTCKKESNCGEQADRPCCEAHENSVEIAVSCDSQPPFLSNIPYANRLFKNVGYSAFQKCKVCQAETATAKAAGSAACCENSTCETPAGCPKSFVQLTSHAEAIEEEASPSREEMLQEMMEMQVEHARLEATMEAMKHHLEHMEEMFEIRLENEILKAKLKHMEQEKAKSASARHPYHPNGTVHTPHVAVGVAHSAHGRYLPHVSHGVKTNLPAITVSPKMLPASTIIQRPAHAANYTSKMPSQAELQRVTEHIQTLHKKLEQREKKCEDAESGCKKPSSK